MNHIAVLMTCHNRREKTLECLRALYLNAVPEDTILRVVLVDDGSTDGTAKAVSEYFPDVCIVFGDGSLFWNGGMRLAYEVAQDEPYDYLLWLNDDTLLEPDALKRLLSTEVQLRKRSSQPVIVVGSTCVPGTGITSYGGTTQPDRFRPLHFVIVQPTEVPQKCDSMNGNCVLIPREIALRVGNLEAHFVHSMGDTDYGLRAKMLGYSLWVLAGHAGNCINDNLIIDSFSDAALSLTARMHKITGPKVLPPQAWMVLTRRHAGPLWPIHWAWPYTKVVLTWFFCRAVSRLPRWRSAP